MWPCFDKHVYYCSQIGIAYAGSISTQVLNITHLKYLQIEFAYPDGDVLYIEKEVHLLRNRPNAIGCPCK